MKTLSTFFRNHTAVIVSVMAVVLVTATSIAVAQSKGNETVKVKIVKIVDGDTTTIEKTMDKASVHDFTRQFENVKGKNVQVMVTVEDVNKDKSGSGRDQSPAGKEKNRSAQSMSFNFNMDSTMAKAFAKAFVFSGDSLKELNFNDTLFKNLPKNFDFNFDFNDEGIMNDFNFDINTDKDGKTVIIKNGKGKTIVINGDEDNVTINKSEEDNGRSKTKTKKIVINDEKRKGKKKGIVLHSVIVMDMDDKDDDVYRSGKTKPKEETNFSFYPNPSDGNFTLDLDLNGKEDAQVKITDMDGKEIYNEK